MATYIEILQLSLPVLPFILLLTMIATGPVLYPKFWHRYYTLIAPILGASVMAYYMIGLGDISTPVHAVAEYINFIALIGALFIASSGILIEVSCEATPWTNLAFLWSGAILSNFIGTTGASMLLIRPYIRLNGKDTRPYHIIFFIFMVSNVGGALTAIADPPNFLGFLRGVPFFWTLRHNFLPWLLALSLLSLIFYFLDKKTALIKKEKARSEVGEGWLKVKGWKNVGWLFLIILAVFVDPNVLPFVPSIPYHGHHFSFLREILLLAISWSAYRQTDISILEANKFSLEPLKEVVFIFMGIFGTMMPALLLIDEIAKSPLGQKAINPHMLYWCTGILSSFLDNAPTYLNFLTAGMASKGLSVHSAEQVVLYAYGAIPYLKATSIAAIFFGAMTYVGNGPNFMVRAIATERDIKMPSFGGYILYYSLPFLLPVLTLIWWVFFY